MTDPVIVETTKWYKSKILWACVLLIVTTVYQIVSKDGWVWDETHLLSLIPAILGAFIGFARAKMPDLLTGIAFFDK